MFSTPKLFSYANLILNFIIFHIFKIKWSNSFHVLAPKIKNPGSALLEMTRANEFKQFDELSICKKLRSILVVRRPRTIKWFAGN